MATQYTAGLSVGQVLTAATMNSIGAAWESYTPTWKQGATTITKTVNYAKYARINKNVIVQVVMTSTGTGTAGGALTISLPTSLNALTTGDSRVIGTFFLQDAGTAFYQGAAIASAATEVSGIAHTGTGYMGNSEPGLTIASGDVISMSIIYEIA